MGTMSSKRLLIVGSSGHAKVAADVALRLADVYLIGLLDRFRPSGDAFFGLQVLGADVEVGRIAGEHDANFVFVAIGDNWSRYKVVELIKQAAPALQFLALVHPSAVIGAGAALGVGSIVCAGAVVGPEASVGQHAIVNTGASLDHEAELGDFASLAPQAAVGGNARIGAFSAIGLGAAVNQQVVVGAHAVVGSGAAVVEDLPAHVLAVGVPTRVVRERQVGDRYL